MKNRTTSLLFTLLAIVSLSACNAITDFSEIKGGYSLEDSLVTPVLLSLSGDTGTIALVFDDALPEAQDEELYALISGKVIEIDVSSAATGTSYSLTQGLRVSDGPNDIGEYSVALSEDRKTMNISFFNEFAGASIQAGGSYSALIQVKENDFFKVGVLAIDDITVVAE